MLKEIERLLNTDIGGIILMLVGLLLMGVCGGIEHGTFPFPF